MASGDFIISNQGVEIFGRPLRLANTCGKGYHRLMISKNLHRTLLVLVVLAIFVPAAFALDVSGAWQTTYGEVVLSQDGPRISGTYYEGRASIDGALDGMEFAFRYDEGNAQGEAIFTFDDDGMAFTGRWRPDGTENWADWNGTRAGSGAQAGGDPTGFVGVFQTSFGLMRLMPSETRVVGCYDYRESSSIVGSVAGNRLTFRYAEPAAAGDGWFSLSSDGNSFAGQWKADGSDSWSEWTGTRVTATPGEKWLIVFETAWEESLRDAPYSFGEMLEVFFKRTPSVRVRRRAVASADDFRRNARALAYLTGPVVILLSGHGDLDGFIAGPDHIPAADIAEAIRLNPEIVLLNFSCCSAMGGDAPRAVRALLPRGHSCAVSGYTTAIDWAASAGLEFLYLDCVLSRGMTPVEAAAVIGNELNFADAQATPDSPFGALGFEIIPPPG